MLNVKDIMHRRDFSLEIFLNIVLLHWGNFPVDS